VFKNIVLCDIIIAEVIIMFKVPRGYNTVSKTFRLPEELMEEMEKLAQNNKISLNKLVVQCLLYAMENIEKPQENEKTKDEI